MKHNENFPFRWVRSNSEKRSLHQILDEEFNQVQRLLSTTGAILFKGFEIDNSNDLEMCVSVFPNDALEYVDGNSPRTEIQNRVYTSTEHPAESFISLHNELSYSAKWPSHIFFCCVIPASSGGHTIIADSREIYNNLSQELISTFETKKVKYIRNLHNGAGAGVSWQNTFETTKKEIVEEYCRRNDVNFEWKENGYLKLSQIRDAVIKHPKTGEKVWFNQADQFHPSTNSPEIYEALIDFYDDPHNMPQYACFADNSEIPLTMLEEIRTVTNKHTVFFAWEKGDLMIVDNILIAHGRSPFVGERKILVSMIE